MSKEQLEEIKEKLNHIRGVLGLVGDQDTVNMAADLDVLIDEQTEREEELERELERIKVKYRVTKESHYNCSKSTSELEQQNEQYRESLRRVREELLGLSEGRDVRPFKIYGIVTEALEEPQ